jgi:two-component system, NtrC family, response regulator AtoC
VVLLELPPLRKRTEDIIPLCLRALVKYSREFGKEILDIEPEARTMLERYAYPGNIRELQNIVERATIFCHGKSLAAACLPSELREAAHPTTTAVTAGYHTVVRLEMPVGRLSLAEAEDAIIQEVLRLTDYNKSLAAKHLGLTRYALDRRLKKILDDDSKLPPAI